MSRTSEGELDPRDKNVQRAAWSALIFFVLVDAAFNMLEVWLSVNPQTLEMKGAAGLYGAFPTIAAALLGALQGYVDRLPKQARPANKEKTRSIAAAIRRLILAAIAKVTKTIRQGHSKPVKAESKLPPLRGKRKAIYDLATRKPDISQPEIAQEIGLSRQRVGQLMQEMRKDGYFNGNGKSN